MAADALLALGALFQWLQDASRQSPAADFRRNALAELREHLPFDRAVWADAAITDSLSLRSAEVFNVAESERVDIEHATFIDPHLPLALQTPGRAYAYSVSAEDPAPYRELARRIGIGHVLSISHFDAVLSIATGLVLSRPPQATPFGEDDRCLVEAAFPHLIAAWTRCQIAELKRAEQPHPAPAVFSAASKGLTFSAADPEFLSLLRQEWPSWVGPYLPKPLIDTATDAVKARYVGDHIVVQAKLAVDTALVTARQRSAVDELTARERTVAELCAQGMTYKEISAALHLAPATARNHIAAVHKRLAVARNGEIARLLAAAGAAS